MAVEVLAGPLWWSRTLSWFWGRRAGPRSARRAGPLQRRAWWTCVPEHMGMSPADLDACRSGKVAQPAGGGVVHSPAAAVEQDRAPVAASDGAVDGTADRRREWHKHHLAAYATDAQDPVAVFLAKVADVRAAGVCARGRAGRDPGGHAGRYRVGCLGPADPGLAGGVGYRHGADRRVVDRAVAGGRAGAVTAVIAGAGVSRPLSDMPDSTFMAWLVGAGWMAWSTRSG